jgi:WD40 repeat protein
LGLRWDYFDNLAIERAQATGLNGDMISKGQNQSMRQLSICMLLMFSLFSFTIEITAQEPIPSIRSVAWSPDGGLIAVGYGIDQCSNEHPEYYDIQILNATTMELLQTLSGSFCYITSIDWHPNSKRLAASSADSVGTRVWDTQTGELLMQVLTGCQGVVHIAWQPPDGLVLAEADVANGASLLDPITGEFIPSGRFGGTSLDWSPDGKKLLLASFYEDTHAYVYDVVADETVFTLEGVNGYINTVDWSPDGTKLASGGGISDPTIHIWDAITGESLVTIDIYDTSSNFIAYRQVRWSPDSSLLASANRDGTVRVWNATTGEEEMVFPYPDSVISVDWSPDGTKLAFGGYGGHAQTAELEIVEIPPR